MGFKKYFTLSYDDGVTQDIRLVEIFNRYGLKCTFNLNSGRFGTDGEVQMGGKKITHNKVEAAAVAEIYAGHEVATHSLTHPSLPALEASQIIAEVRGDRLELSRLVGYEVNGHAYPGGHYDERVARILKNDCGIRYARTVKSTFDFCRPTELLMWNPTCRHGDVGVPELLDKFIQAEPTDSDLLFYLWGHSYELDFGNELNSWEYIERLCERIAGKSDIIYCTNGEFLSLTQE